MENQTSIDFKSSFNEALNTTTMIPFLISGGCSSVIAKCDNNSLTDMRVQYFAKVLANVFAYRNHSSEVIVSSGMSSSKDPSKCSHFCVVGPVINPLTKKKDTTTSFEEYARLRQTYIKSRDHTESKKMSEVWITEAVICYDFLHSDITKPMHAVGLQGLEVDHSFREAIKILYNRSRVACIIQKFEVGVKKSLYPPLPSLEMTNFKLLKKKAEIEITSKYIDGFGQLLEKFTPDRIAKITAELWRFLLFLSQDYSNYYSQVRTLCDEHNRSHSTMHARIWMLKVILTIYDTAFAFLNLKPLDYV